MVRAYTSDRYDVPLPARHRFPMRKYRWLREALLDRAILEASAIRDAEPIDLAALGRVHEETYIRRLIHGTLTRREERRLGFPWSHALIRRSRASVGATVAAARTALRAGLAANLAGGTHHAHVDWGSGYCLFNDGAVAIRTLQAEGRIRRALVIDLDVHQGDGTATIFRHDPTVVTASIHGARNFPFRKAESDVDVALPDGADDATYRAHLDRLLPDLIDDARPDLIAYIAGADVLAADRLGTLALTVEGVRERDRMGLGACADRGVPTVLVMGGGYGQPLDETIAAQCATFRVAVALSGTFASAGSTPEAPSATRH